MNQYLYLILAWLVYGFIHSLLASAFIKKLLPTPYYRLAYNTIAILLFVVLILFQFKLPQDQLWTSNLFSQISGIVFVLIGIWSLYKAFSNYDLSEFSGFDALQKSKNVISKFRTNGILQIIRHPIYTGIILVVFGLFVYDTLLRSLITAFCVTFYIRIGIYFEEKKLVIEFGESYLKYRQKVPMLFPKFNHEL